ncbi:MAG: adenylate kinase [Halanaerobiales bacterium]|nr:adenylate kinase [Halanaerobiales bacterium]
MNLIILGLPAAGKGTQAKKISQEYNLTHISTGDILRKAATEKSLFGKEIKKYLDAGELVPDEMAIGIVKEKLLKEDLDAGVVFDGFPRTPKQAEALTEILAELGKKLDLAIYIKADEAEIIRRISGRRVCRDCGASYHLDYNPPEKERVCDRCGGKLIQRSDDQEETVKKRIRLHSKLLAQLISYYEEKAILKTVLSKGGIEEVFARIKEIIEVNL